MRTVDPYNVLRTNDVALWANKVVLRTNDVACVARKRCCPMDKRAPAGAGCDRPEAGPYNLSRAQSAHITLAKRAYHGGFAAYITLAKRAYHVRKVNISRLR